MDNQCIVKGVLEFFCKVGEDNMRVENAACLRFVIVIVVYLFDLM